MRRRTLSAGSAALLVVALATATVPVAAPALADGRGDTRFTKAVANGGRPVVVGPSAPTSYPVRLWVSDSSGVKSLDVDTFSAANGLGYADVVSGSCTKTSTTMSLCTRNLRLDAAGLAGYSDRSANIMAGSWQLYASAHAKDGDYRTVDDLIRFPVLRRTKLTISPANPQTVGKGRTLTFTGRLSHADWEHQRWASFGGQRVELRFKRAGATSFSSVRTVTTSRRGYVSAKVTVNVAGTYRWRFPHDGRNAVGLSTVTPVALR